MSQHERDLKPPQNWPNKHQAYFKPFIFSPNEANRTFNILPTDYHKFSIKQNSPVTGRDVIEDIVL